MPLDKSGTKESIGNNIRIERAAGRPQAQAIAIAESEYRAHKGHPSMADHADAVHPTKKGY
jgi:hypothetical protein